MTLTVTQTTIPPELDLNATGFIVHLPEDCAKYADLYPRLKIKDQVLGFLTDVIGLLIENPSFKGYVSFSQIEEHLGHNWKKSTIYNRVKQLNELGLFLEQEVKVPNARRPVRLFTIGEPVLDEIPSQLRKTEKAKSFDIKPDYNAVATRTKRVLATKYPGQMMSGKLDSHYRDGFLAILSKCIILNAKDDKDILKTEFSYKGDPVIVKTVKLSDNHIMCSADLRYTTIITSLCLQNMKDHLTQTQDISLPPENAFIVDLNEDICEKLGVKKTTGNRKTAFKAISRIAGTEFKIIGSKTGEFSDRFQTIRPFRFLNDLQGIGYVEGESQSDVDYSPDDDDLENPRFVKFRLDVNTFNSYWFKVRAWFERLSPEDFKKITVYLQNPDVARHHHASVTQQLNAHLQSWVPTTGTSKKTCTTVSLHQHMLPHSTYGNFLRDLTRLLNSLVEDGTEITPDTEDSKVLFFGYWIETRPLNSAEKKKIKPRRSGYHLTFYRDVNDKYVGDNSVAHRLNKLERIAEQEDAEKAAQEYLAAKKELGKDIHDIDIPPSTFHLLDGLNSIREDSDIDFSVMEDREHEAGIRDVTPVSDDIDEPASSENYEMFRRVKDRL